MLFKNKNVDHTPNNIHLFGNLRRAAPFRAFEKQMLDKVRNAVLGYGFIARSTFHPDAETHRTMLQHLIRHNADAVVQVVLSKHITRCSSCRWFPGGPL